MQLAEQNFEVYLFPNKLLKTIDLAHNLFRDPRYDRNIFIKKTNTFRVLGCSCLKKRNNDSTYRKTMG